MVVAPVALICLTIRVTLRSSDRKERRLLTSLEAAELLRYSTTSGFRRWADRSGVIPLVRGRKLVWDISDLERGLSGRVSGQMAALLKARLEPDPRFTRSPRRRGQP